MIPILFEKNEMAFSSNGLGRLSDITSCIVVEGRNDVYECEFQYPVTGIHFDEIIEGRIITCTHDETGDLQPFDIYAASKPIDGIVTFKAAHISYRLNEITVKPFNASTCSAAIAAIKTNSINTNPFTFWTDKSVTAEYSVSEFKAARGLLGGTEGSILDVFGTGEYEFDKFAVKLHSARGSVTNVQIRYGKNLVDLNDETDYSGTYNGVAPFWKGTEMDDETGDQTDIFMFLPEFAVYSGNSTYGGRNIVIPLDLSNEFDEQPSENNLRTAAAAHLGGTEAPDRNITVDFVQLWQTEEYADFAPLERCNLCDTVSVFYPALNISTSQKIIKVEWDALLERYSSMELGQPRESFGQLISEKAKAAVDVVKGSVKAVSQIADNTNQYFWQTSVESSPGANDTGAHITEITREEFMDDPENGGPNLLLRSTGLAVRDGEKELAVFSSSLIALKDSDENVIFSVASASGAVRTFISWGYLVSAESPFSEKVDLGRSMDSLEDITVYYTVNGTAKTRTYSSLPVEDTPWSADPEESEDVSGYELAVEITQQDDRHLYFSISSDQSDVVLTKIIVNFVTTQITAEMELGAFPDEAMSGPLKIGKGLSAAAPANALAIDWNGAGYFGGDDIRVGCNDDSTGGVSLYQGIRIDSVYNFDYVDGAHSFCDVSMTKVGRLVQLDIMIERDITTPVGTNMFSGSMPAEIPMPAMDWASGSNYYSRSVLHAMLAKNYNNEPPTLSLVIRNEGPETIAADALVHIPVVYIAEKEEANDESE